MLEGMPYPARLGLGGLALALGRGVLGGVVHVVHQVLRQPVHTDSL